jgi:UDP-glucose 4-epimerase
MAFHRLCRAAIEQRPFTVFGDGRQTRDFCYVSDIVDGTKVASGVEESGRIFNLAGGSPASLREVTALVEELAGHELEVRYRDAETGDVRDTAADITQARKALNFSPQTSLAIGLRAEFEWMAAELGRNRLAES